MPENDADKAGSAVDMLWEQYRDIVTALRGGERKKAVSTYRMAQARERRALDAAAVPPAMPPPPPPLEVTPIPAVDPAPKTPEPLRQRVVVKNAIAAGGGAALAFAAMMRSGWEHSPGNEIIPFLVVVGLVIGLVAGVVFGGLVAVLERQRYKREKVHYEAMAPIVLQQMFEQQTQMDLARMRAHDHAAAQMTWQQQYYDWSRQVALLEQRDAQTRLQSARTGTPALDDAAILQRWDADTDSVIDTMLTLARTAGSTPENTPRWIGCVAEQLKLSCDVIDTLTGQGWTVTGVRAQEHRMIVTVDGAGVPEPTTLMLHHATSDQLSRREMYVVAYDDDSLSYRPAPQSDHELPKGCPPRIVHTYTRWKVRGIPATGFGIIGSTAFIASPDTVPQAIAAATL